MTALTIQAVYIGYDPEISRHTGLYCFLSAVRTSSSASSRVHISEATHAHPLNTYSTTYMSTMCRCVPVPAPRCLTIRVRILPSPRVAAPFTPHSTLTLPEPPFMIIKSTYYSSSSILKLTTTACGAVCRRAANLTGANSTCAVLRANRAGERRISSPRRNSAARNPPRTASPESYYKFTR